MTTGPDELAFVNHVERCRRCARAVSSSRELCEEGLVLLRAAVREMRAAKEPPKPS